MIPSRVGRIGKGNKGAETENGYNRDTAMKVSDADIVVFRGPGTYNAPIKNIITTPSFFLQ